MVPTAPTEPVAPAADGVDLLAGTPYRALGFLGKGGMGEVVEAEHRTLRKRVVVKLLHRQLAGDPRFADRMRVEAQSLAALSSPHLVNVTDLGETADGRPFLVMERLHGRTLGDELRARGWLPAIEAIGVVRQVLAGLAAAHQIGIIHRDVKADNVFLCTAPLGPPLVKVLDFGIAKMVQRGDQPLPLPAPQYETDEGALIGSPRTLSPEQARCQKVDARSDVYAVGLMLYTLIVGEGPFSYAADMLDLLNAHIRDNPRPPSKLAKQFVPPELDRAVLRALAKRPDDRFQTAESFSDELGRIAAMLSGTTQPYAVMPWAQPANAGQEALRAPPPPCEATPEERTVEVPALAHRSPGALGADVDAWFAPEAQQPPLTELPPNMAAPPAEPPGEALREFIYLTALSTVAFGLVAAIVFRYLGWH